MPPRPVDEISRREFLSVMAASMAMATLTGCSAARPEKIVPYVRAPEDLLPGKPMFFATAMQSPGGGLGLVVASHEGRPIKVEGNPDHPASLGATDIFAQASVLTLYDPDRAQTITQNGQISTWDALITGLQDAMARFQTNRGAGLRILTETVLSPTLADLLDQLLARYPTAAWHQYDPVNRDNARAGARMAFGKYVDTLYEFEDADLILSLDSDFLSWQPGHLHYARNFARRRHTGAGERGMNRLYVIESAVTTTGAMADHRFPVRSSDIVSIAHSIAARLGSGPPQNPAEMPWLNTLLQELEDHRRRSIVIAGDTQPAEVHALVHFINDRLGNIGRTVRHTEPAEASPVEQTQSMRQLADDMAADRVDTLLIIGGNPAYNAPADFEFAERLSRVPLRIHQSLYFDETAERCHWHIPETHYLESWGDVLAWNGTTSIVQPLMIPLYQSKTSYELLAALLGNPSQSNYEIIRSYWQKRHRGDDFESFWIRAVRQGVVPGSEAHPNAESLRAALPSASEPAKTGGAMEIVFRPDPTIFDGRWANNAWLQELPKPITTLTWDNAALISPEDAERLGVRNSDVIEIKSQGRSLKAAVLISRGHANGSITLTLGYGRHRSGRVGNGRGYNAYSIRTAAMAWITTDAEVRRTGERYRLVTTQEHHELDHRHIVRFATAEEYARNPGFARDEIRTPEPDETLYPKHENIDYAWGMAIDLSACNGCSACVVACQSENNIPVVGKREVANSREMHWLRIDTYFEGGVRNPNVYFEPMLCQHCENAPCELVCPVEATSHSAEGINEMTYNRCVGTRYCSNNCPYKVRRFNFFEYTEWNIPQFKLLYNPDVTVRSRGVMEKCTYCIQRINRARIAAKEEDRKIRDGEVVTACQAACPAEAITFGNVNDPQSRVSKRKAEARNYGVLAELNTRPRTTYLAKLTNPNPAFTSAESVGKVG